MTIDEIYKELKRIVYPINAHSDQLAAIAGWIGNEFEYKATPPAVKPRADAALIRCPKCDSRHLVLFAEHAATVITTYKDGKIEKLQCPAIIGKEIKEAHCMCQSCNHCWKFEGDVYEL